MMMNKKLNIFSERDKRTNNDPQNIRRKLKIEQHEPLYKSDVLS
jgi:hypothetical protein